MIDTEASTLNHRAESWWFHGAPPLSSYQDLAPFVYYIQCGAFVKIGTSIDPEKRCDQLRRGGKARRPSIWVGDPGIVAHQRSLPTHHPRHERSRLVSGRLMAPHIPIEGEDWMPYGWCGSCEVCDRMYVPIVCAGCSYDSRGNPYKRPTDWDRGWGRCPNAKQLLHNGRKP